MRLSNNKHHKSRHLVRLRAHLEGLRMPASQSTLLTETIDLIIRKDAIEVDEINALRHGSYRDEEQRHEHQCEEGVLVSAYAANGLGLLHAVNHDDGRKHEESDGRHKPRVEVSDKLGSLVGVRLKDRRDGTARKQHVANKEVANEDGSGDNGHGQQQGVENLYSARSHERGEQEHHAEQHQAKAYAYGHGAKREVLCQQTQYRHRHQDIEDLQLPFLKYLHEGLHKLLVLVASLRSPPG